MHVLLAGGNHFVSLGRSRTSAAAEVPAEDTEAPPGGYPTAAAQADTLHEKHRARTSRYPACAEDGSPGARQSREARLVSTASPSVINIVGVELRDSLNVAVKATVSTSETI
jgi:hypothetical protein